MERKQAKEEIPRTLKEKVFFEILNDLRGNLQRKTAPTKSLKDKGNKENVLQEPRASEKPNEKAANPILDKNFFKNEENNEDQIEDGSGHNLPLKPKEDSHSKREDSLIGDVDPKGDSKAFEPTNKREKEVPRKELEVPREKNEGNEEILNFDQFGKELEESHVTDSPNHSKGPFDSKISQIPKTTESQRSDENTIVSSFLRKENEESEIKEKQKNEDPPKAKKPSSKEKKENSKPSQHLDRDLFIKELMDDSEDNNEFLAGNFETSDKEEAQREIKGDSEMILVSPIKKAEVPSDKAAKPIQKEESKSSPKNPNGGAAQKRESPNSTGKSSKESSQSQNSKETKMILNSVLDDLKMEEETKQESSKRQPEAGNKAQTSIGKRKNQVDSSLNNSIASSITSKTNMSRITIRTPKTATAQPPVNPPKIHQEILKNTHFLMVKRQQHDETKIAKLKQLCEASVVIFENFNLDYLYYWLKDSTLRKYGKEMKAAAQARLKEMKELSYLAKELGECKEFKDYLLFKSHSYSLSNIFQEFELENWPQVTEGLSKEDQEVRVKEFIRKVKKDEETLKEQEIEEEEEDEINEIELIAALLLAEPFKKSEEIFRMLKEKVAEDSIAKEIWEDFALDLWEDTKSDEMIREFCIKLEEMREESI